MNHSIRRVSVFPLLASLLLLSVAAFAAEPRITATSHAEPSHKLTPAERRAISLAAGRILRHTYLARQALTEEDGKKAAQEVAQGLILVQIIESAQPKYTVTAEIKAGKLSYSADEVVTPPLVPIYDEVGEVELVGPLAAARREQTSRSDATDVVDDVDAEQTSVFLNLAFAKAGLTQAKKALAEGDLKAADRGLALVQQSVRFEVDLLDVPLATVRENLHLAHSRAQIGDLKDARTSLDAASAALERYAKIAEDKRSAEVEQLRGEIHTLSNDIASGKQEASATAKVEDEILSLWDRVHQWWEERPS
jgi:hypothetical protein